MIKALFAVDKFGGMGFNGTLPWPHCPEDLANFKKLTNGHIVVMGRASWDDPKLPKPLVGRTVYVATHRPVAHATPISGDISAHLLRLEKQFPDKIIWVVGGAALLLQCTDVLDKIHLTHFQRSYKIDTRIDLKSFLAEWRVTSGSASPNANYTFITYEKLFARTKPDSGDRQD